MPRDRHSNCPSSTTISTALTTTGSAATTSNRIPSSSSPSPPPSSSSPLVTTIPGVGCPPSVSTPASGATPSPSSITQYPPNTVFLNVYDVLTPSDPKTIPRINDVLLHCGIGIFHTGIQVWGREFAFGGHSDPDSGIFEVTPRHCPAVRYRSTLCLGVTALSERHVDRLIHILGMTEYLGHRYSLISRNCNTFSAHLARLLGVHDKFPPWVNRLAGLALNVRCLLPEPLLHPLSEGVPGGPLLKEPQKPPRVATL